jgi:hypothetical protein
MQEHLPDIHAREELQTRDWDLPTWKLEEQTLDERFDVALRLDVLVQHCLNWSRIYGAHPLAGKPIAMRRKLKQLKKMRMSILKEMVKGACGTRRMRFCS